MTTRKQVNASNIDNAQAVVNYQGTPDECPACHRGINPRVVNAVMLGDFGNPENSKLRIVFQCTRLECMEAFFGYYHALHAWPFSPESATGRKSARSWHVTTSILNPVNNLSERRTGKRTGKSPAGRSEFRRSISIS